MRVFPVILATAIAGCATVGGEKVEQLGSGTTIAAVSVMGDRLAVREVGTTVFQNQKKDIDVTPWGIDRYSESVAGQLLEAKGKFRIVPADTAKVRHRVKLEEDFWTGGNKITAGNGPLASLAAQSKADYLLLIAPASMGDPFMGTNQTISGYGIYQRSFMGIKKSMNFITMKTILVEAKTGREVARTQCALSNGRPTWLDSKNVAELGESTRTGIKDLFEDGLRKCLGSLNLG